MGIRLYLSCVCVAEVGAEIYSRKAKKHNDAVN
jgi:hypothetical protein